MAWAIILIAIIHPPHGTGLPICWLASSTGIPCPGCGMTRSMSCAMRGMFAESWSYHPFGGVSLAAFLAIAIAGAWCHLAGRDFSGLANDYRRPLRITYLVMIAGFVIFGGIRAVIHIHGVGH